MDPETQRGVPPSRPPPPSYPSAPPPYIDPQGNMYPMGQPETLPCGVPSPAGAPPPYYAPQSNQVGYPAAPVPGGYAIPPNQPQQGGYHGLYPDVSQLPQPQAVPLGFVSPGGHQIPSGPYQTNPEVLQMGSPSMPVRPAPCPPGHVPQDYSQGVPVSHAQGQAPWWTTLKEGEAPPGCVISWKGGDGLKIYFIQEEGHIVSPNKSFQMAVYKRINGRGDVVEEALVGMIEILGSWRLRLHGKTSFALHTYSDTYIFLDDSTCPSKSGRYVIIELPADVSKRMRADLLALLQELTDLREEQEGVVGKITTNVETVYTDITKKLNTVVKDNVPGAHKSTKWLRKGTGNLVRMGGNLVSKGMHFIADQMPANQTQTEEESPVHTELMEALTKFHKSKEEGTITFV